jgi:hypothetical protein
VGLTVWSANRVPDRGSDPNYVVRTEIHSVVLDVVVADLGADKRVMPEVVAQSRSGIDQKMIRTVVASVEVNAARAVIEVIEPRALPPNSAQQISADLLADIWLIHAIKGEKNRPVRLAGILVIALAAAPVHVETRTVAMMENDVAANVYIESALFRTNVVSRPSEIAASVAVRRGNSSEADRSIALLSETEAGKEYKRNSSCEERQLSQRNLLVFRASPVK